VVLASVSQYFHAMFTNCVRNNKALVVIKQLDSTIVHITTLSKRYLGMPTLLSVINARYISYKMI